MRQREQIATVSPPFEGGDRGRVYSLSVLLESADGRIYGFQRNGKSLLTGLMDIFTVTNFLIAMISAAIGYLVLNTFAKSSDRRRVRRRSTMVLAP